MVLRYQKKLNQRDGLKRKVQDETKESNEVRKILGQKLQTKSG